MSELWIADEVDAEYIWEQFIQLGWTASKLIVGNRMDDFTVRFLMS